jgi:c-di-GMP-related signal transduction protein
VKLASKISDVLLELSPDTERLTILYKLARRYEAGDWDEVVALAEQLGVPPGTVGDAYVDAVRWSNELIEKT